VPEVADRLSPGDGATPGTLPRVRLFGLPFVAAASVEQVAVELLARSRAGERGLLVVTPNVDHLVQYGHEPRLQALAAQADYVLPDGSPIIWASKLLRRPLGARLTGSDLFAPIWTALKQSGEPIVVLATNDDSAERLAADHPGAHVVVAPFFAADDHVARRALVERTLAEVDASGARVVVVGLPLPKHHDIAADLRAAGAAGRAAPTLLLIGSAADFYIGTKQRAPQLMQRLGLEWLHRLLSEPRRLAKRYLVDDMAFVPIVVREAVHVVRHRRGGDRV
jgi:N-acetylglucosaminyldiphosphoundecaprenol N-acetyl-beta-D-mannosaminyltransferase